MRSSNSGKYVRCGSGFDSPLQKQGTQMVLCPAVEICMMTLVQSIINSRSTEHRRKRVSSPQNPQEPGTSARTLLQGGSISRGAVVVRVQKQQQKNPQVLFLEALGLSW